MIVWVHGRIEIVGMIEYAEMKSLHKMKKYGMIELKSAHDWQCKQKYAIFHP